MTEYLLDQLACTSLRGVGPKLALQLAKCQIETVQDLLFHLPMRYQDRTHITPMRDLKVGDHAVVEGVIKSSRVQWGKKSSLICDISDETSHLSLRFFHFNQQQQSSLTKGTHIHCFGEVRYGTMGPVMIHPEYRILLPGKIIEVDEYLTPIYPSTEGLNQRTWRNLTDQALAFLSRGALLKEYLPEEVRQQFNLSDLGEALLYVHRPPPDALQKLLLEGNHPMQKRLVFEELIAHNISMRRIRKNIQNHPACALSPDTQLREQFVEKLPFTLTNAQKRVCEEIYRDLQNASPMLRLVQGDVGSGKTVIAVLSMLQAVANGYQACLMAPTEILAEQHHQTLMKWLTPLGITVAWLCGKLKGKKREVVLEQLETGAAQVIVGTHALFQKDVNYNKLALVVIDEQHRFGVHQRMALRDKALLEKYYPHQLIMTATPIPRTLAMTAYADLDVSVIDELPPGRTPINTIAIPNTRRQEVIERVRQVCQEGCQAYWVCTLIEESELLECQAAEVTQTELCSMLSDLKIGLVHGRLTSQEKDQVMDEFKKGEIDLLVATTVIEVGVDVPNASLMIIENPERLGLAQLHQLRGRVGRGSIKSHCVLLYKSPLSEHAKARLTILRETNDGFLIANKDLELRGPGEVLGIKQTGLIQFKIADISRDQAMIPTVQKAAIQIMQHHPHCEDLLVQRWLGTKERYGEV